MLKESIQWKFTIGECVRVKAGITDPDFPELPLDGWGGVVCDIHVGTSVAYLIQWGHKTLQHTPPAYRERCSREDLAFEVMWLTEDDLDSDNSVPQPGEMPVMEAVHADWAFADNEPVALFREPESVCTKGSTEDSWI